MKKVLYCKRTLCCLLLLCCVWTGVAQEMNLDWVTQVGGSCWNDEDDVVKSVALDKQGNVYTAGIFCGTADFDPGPANHNVTADAFMNNSFIYKLTASGSLVWVKMFSSGIAIGESGLAVDSVGNVYLTGSYNGTVDFDLGPDSFKLTTLPNHNGAAFVLKLDSSGSFIWAKSLESKVEWRNIYGTDIAVDRDGNVLSTGVFQDTADFNPGTGPADTFTMAAAGAFDGEYDIYILKLDSAGNFIWAKRLGGEGNDEPRSLTVDIAGNVYTTGELKSTVDFDPGVGVSTLTSTGYYDVFISKLDAGGAFVWAKAFLGNDASNYDRVTPVSIAVDASGNVYTKGTFAGTVDFDPGPLTNNLTSASPNTFVSKLDTSGNFLWIRNWSTTGNPIGSLALDTSGNIYSTGIFEGTTDFDPGTGTFNITTAGVYDIFTSKLTTNGDFVWAKAMGGYGYDKGYSIAVDASGKNVYTAGSFAIINGGQADFDPGPGSAILTATGFSDGFIQKMSCNSYGSLTVADCDSFTYNGITYLESGIYTAAPTPNAVGCDSIVTIDLTLTHSTHSSISETACDSFNVNGQTYTTTGIYVLQTLTNAIGCDSLLLLDLTISDISTDVTQTGNTLAAVTSGATYQWIDCNNNQSPVSGATQQIFTATNDGSYAVIITKNDCKDTSDCYNVSGTGIHDPSADDLVHVYPNPTSGILTISSGTFIKDGQLRLINIIGQSIQEAKLTGHGFRLDLSKFPPGNYILEIKAEGQVSRTKIVKK